MRTEICDRCQKEDTEACEDCPKVKKDFEDRLQAIIDKQEREIRGD